MSMIPYPHQTGKMILGIYKHVLISFYQERPLQLRLRPTHRFVTNFVKFYTNLCPFLWDLSVFMCIITFFISTWLFVFLSFRTNVRNPFTLLQHSKHSRECFVFCHPSFTERNYREVTRYFYEKLSFDNWKSHTPREKEI